ncbi:MAG: hypothetical protein QG670_1498 [Thermoproteota archaeon]|nr:hypothetical protein [Thermoproteota archaeon]
MTSVIKYKTIKTGYWRPKTDYCEIIAKSVEKLIEDGDIIVVSEKAISIAEGNILDESKIKPGFSALFLAKFWSQIIWGYILGTICHFKTERIKHLRRLPIREGAAHKQLILNYAGLLQAMKYGSEGGIDINNMPYSYACLPLSYPTKQANQILDIVTTRTGKTVTVMVTDTDSTFSFHNFHFTSRPTSIRGIFSYGGFFSFTIGRSFKLRQRATPLAIAGQRLDVNEALHYAEIAHHARGYGAGRTIWNAADKFRVRYDKITWEMLDSFEHFPIVLIRSLK